MFGVVHEQAWRELREEIVRRLMSGDEDARQVRVDGQRCLDAMNYWNETQPAAPVSTAFEHVALRYLDGAGPMPVLPHA